MKKLSVFLSVVVLLFGIIGNVNAALIDRGGGLIYDSDQNITWLQDANYAKTSMTSEAALVWADSLAYYDSVRNVTWTDWRLPKTVNGLYVFGYDGTTTGGYNITTSEMGYMYYVNLGNKGYYATDGTNPQPGWGLTNTGPFTNVQSFVYWSGTLYLGGPGAWDFHFSKGTQFNVDFDNHLSYAWAVMDGDVAPIPIPGAIWLLGSGLIGIVGLRKKF